MKHFHVLGQIALSTGIYRLWTKSPTIEDSLFVPLKVRRYDADHETSVLLSEKKAINRSALILIDIWKETPSNVTYIQHVEQRLAPLVKLFRAHGIPIVHAPHGREIASAVAPHENEIVLDGPFQKKRLIEWLQKRDIRVLFYAGYSLNLCVFERPVGTFALHNAGYEIIVVRDATTASETPETREGEWARKVSLNMVERYMGSTTTLADLATALLKK
ncbi:MAG: cysteine hydrolase [Deltaproteobacteria bacterium]|nr:cysteine hydrolase [Deltaproteobacteria bacterium]